MDGFELFKRNRPAHLNNRQATFPRMDMPMIRSKNATIRRKVSRGVIWASFAPYQVPTVNDAARRPPNARSSCPYTTFPNVDAIAIGSCIA